MAENDQGDGITKVLIDNEYDKIIGVQIIGSYASEIIYGAGLMIETELPVEDIKELVFPHPTVSEVIREAIFSK
jgi:dihydrolipoamide dehydrogenase